MKIPEKCPSCNERVSWVKIDKQHKGVSLGKAALGIALFGGVGGVVGGLMGKKRVTYHCRKCGFTHEY